LNAGNDERKGIRVPDGCSKGFIGNYIHLVYEEKSQQNFLEKG